MQGLAAAYVFISTKNGRDFNTLEKMHKNITLQSHQWSLQLELDAVAPFF